MDFEKELQRIANQYVAEGFVVALFPKADILPDWAADVGADILAVRGDEHVLIQVKADRASLQTDSNVPKRAQLVNAHPGWQYDLVVLREDNHVRRDSGVASEPSPEQIEQLLKEAEVATQTGTFRAGFVLAWGALEASLRRLARRSGIEGKIGTPPHLLIRDLVSSGALTHDDYSFLETSRRIRTEVVHGLAGQPIDQHLVEHLLSTTRRIFEEAELPLMNAG